MSVTTTQQTIVPSSTNFNMNLSNFEKHGIPKEHLDSLKPVLQEQLQQFEYQSDPMHEQLQNCYNEVFPAIEDLPNILKKGYRIKIHGQWRKYSPEESVVRLLHNFLLLRPLLLEFAVASLDFLPFKQVLHYLISAYCKLKNSESMDFLAIPANLEVGDSRTIVCAKENEIWVAEVRKINLNNPEPEFIILSPNRRLLVDETNRPINQRYIQVTFGMNLNDKTSKKLFFENFSKNQALPNSAEFSLIFDFAFYTGLPNKYPAPNTLSVSGTLNSSKECEFYPSNEAVDSQITDSRLVAQAQEFAFAYINWKKDEIIHKFEDKENKTLTYSLCFPSSSSEFKLIERRLLEEMAKNPEEHIETIQWLIETSHLTLSAQDPSTEESEEVFITAKQGIDLLLEAYPVPDTESIDQPSIDNGLVQEDKKRKQEIEKTASTSSTTTTHHSNKPHSHKRHKDKKEVKQQEKTTAVKPTTRGLVLSSEERSQVRQVMQGHSMKGDDFVKFGLTLLKRKVEKLNLRQAGSHINAARQTLVRIHRNGRKDLQGMVSHQKSFLREVLAPSDN